VVGLGGLLKLQGLKCQTRFIRGCSVLSLEIYYFLLNSGLLLLLTKFFSKSHYSELWPSLNSWPCLRLLSGACRAGTDTKKQPQGLPFSSSSVTDGWVCERRLPNGCCFYILQHVLHHGFIVGLCGSFGIGFDCLLSSLRVGTFLAQLLQYFAHHLGVGQFVLQFSYFVFQGGYQAF
jgi:hypothetical protein